MKIIGICEFCHREVDEYQSHAFPVHGWEVKRRQGGANKITGKVRQPNRVAHATCLESVLRRPNQMELP